MVCTTITWRGKSAVRDVARALGLDVDVGARLAVVVGGGEAGEAAERLAAGSRPLEQSGPRVDIRRARWHRVGFETADEAQGERVFEGQGAECARVIHGEQAGVTELRDRGSIAAKYGITAFGESAHALGKVVADGGD